MIEVNVLTCKTQGLGLFFELTGRDYHPGSQNSASAYFASASGLIYLAIIKIFRDCNSNRLTILQRFSTLFNAFQCFSTLFNALLFSISVRVGLPGAVGKAIIAGRCNEI